MKKNEVVILITDLQRRVEKLESVIEGFQDVIECEYENRNDWNEWIDSSYPETE